MRFLIAIILILLAFYYFLPEPEPKPIEETFIGPQLEPLREAEGFEADYLKANEERQRQMEEELEKASGGG